MPHETTRQRIERGHKAVGKTHEFDDNHDPTRPVRFFFQNSHEGLVLFVIFHTQACRWQRCISCNLPSTASRNHIGFEDIMEQVKYLFNHHEIKTRAQKIRKVIVSNQGSVLDQKTFSSAALVYFIAMCNKHLPNMAVLSFESRAEYVDDAELEFVRRAVDEGQTPTTFEVAVGFEAFDNQIRERVFLKGLPLNQFERLVARLAKHGFHTKCYFMFKPVPGMTEEEAVADIQAAIDYLSRIQDRIPGAVISMHLNPTFAASGTPLETALKDGSFTPPRLVNVVKAVQYGEGRGITIFVGLDDEGLACKGGSFIREGDGEIVRRIEAFNATQDYSQLEEAA